jgi:hypothetical protein
MESVKLSEQNNAPDFVPDAPPSDAVDDLPF